MRKKITSLLIAYLPAILWASLIFVLSSQSVLASLELSIADFILKKFAHIFVYFVLYYLLFRANYLNTKQTKFSFILPLLICFIYAISDELHQSLTPGRHATIRDIGYDSLGMMLAFLRIYHYI